jgi:cytidylate kinase
MPIIAISRGTFSGGEALADAVAQRLAYRCVSREDVVAVAQAYGVPAEEITAAMEKRPSLLNRVVGDQTVYLAFMRAALCERARGDQLVYHGHLGHFLLPGVAHVLSIRVVADREYRLRALERDHQLGGPEARAYLERVDQERREWTRFLFGVDWDEPLLYDLVLNLSRMALETACALVAQAAHRPEFQPTPASRQALEDLSLRSWAEVRSRIGIGPMYRTS